MDIKRALNDILLKSLDFDQVTKNMSFEQINTVVYALNIIEEKLIKADELYHIHVGGHRVSDKPMSLSDIEAQHGPVKELESNSEVKLVPHIMEKVEFSSTGQWSLDKQERWSDKPKESSGTVPTLDYSKFNKPKPQEERVLDYGKINDPSAQKPKWKTNIDPQRARDTWNRINRQRREQTATGVIKDK